MKNGTDNGGKKRTRTCLEVDKNGKKVAITPETVKGNIDGAFILRLPCHLLLEIFLRLPVKTILQCYSVCRAWRSLIFGSQFANLYFLRVPDCILVQWNISNRGGSRNLSLLEPGLLPSSDAILRIRIASNFPKLGTEIVGSCNGLLCMYDRHNNGAIYISNPITGEHLDIQNAVDDPTLYFIWGFGQSSENNEYKVVQILRKLGYDSKMEAKVWTVGTNGWRSLGDLRYSFSGQSFGTLLNGTLHWVIDYSTSYGLICSFDLKSESFKRLRLPPSSRFGSWGKAVVLEGCLCVGFSGKDDNGHSSIDIWVMNDYGIKKSWTKKYVVRNQRLSWWDTLSCQVIGAMRNSGDLLLLCDFNLFSYNPTTERLKRIEIDGVRSLVEAICHAPSFFSPKDVVMQKVQRH